MRRYLRIFGPLFGLCLAAHGHDLITTKITWNREISRLVYSRCVSCHKEGGRAFSLMTYQQARPWATAIKEEVLERRMPPWGAVKGFGDFRNDQALSQEQLELIAAWAEGGAPEGDDKDLPADGKPPPPLRVSRATGGIEVAGEFRLASRFVVDGLQPKVVPEGASLQITAELPDGSVEPLLWLRAYRKEFDHPFLLRTPLTLPAGTVIHGIAPGASVILLPRAAAAPAKTQTAHRTSPINKNGR